MSQPIGPNLRKFLETTMAQTGRTLLSVAAMPGARLAQEQDFKDARSTDGAKSVGEWLKNYDGQGFKSKEDREAAFSDPAYQNSPGYRAAVARMAMDSSDEIMGLQRPLAHVPTNEQMLKQARIDAYHERRSELVSKASQGGPGSANARLELMQFHEDPANQEILAEFERDERALKPLEYELKDAKARGERVGTALSEEKPADSAEGEAQASNQHPSGRASTPWNS